MLPARLRVPYHPAMAQQLGPARFIAKWSPIELSERAASQEHFIDLCRLLGQPTPADHDATGAEYTFEKGVTPTAGASRGAAGTHGFADVWWRGKFAWEYKRKGKYKDLKEAYRQLSQYREALENPPLLIVSDIGRTEIHTNFTGTVKQIHVVELATLDAPESLNLLRRVFTDPDSFRPDITAAKVTEDVARQFAALAQSLRSRGHDPHTAAHFLMKCMFCLFAEDVGLLPGQLFSRLVERTRRDPTKLTERLTELFDTMRTGGDFGVDAVAHFNGGLFDDSPALKLTAADIDTLLAAATPDWGSVEPAIFGTLFERSLDPNTRAQIGAHYTSREDIMLVVEPVVMAPLRREWEAVKAEVEAQLARRRRGTTRKTKGKAEESIAEQLQGFVHRLATVRILDPACGSGNFLYVAIQQLLALEKEVITYAARPEIALGLFPQVRPTQLHGIEINPYAAELAQVVIWIGYLQWMRDNGYIDGIRIPILEPLQTIECRDAILEFLPESVSAPAHSCGADSEPPRSRGGDSARLDSCGAGSEPPRSRGGDSARLHSRGAGSEPPRSRGGDSARHECRGSGGGYRGSEFGESPVSGGRGGCYLLTWTTYGTWLPGDERGFVGRVPDAGCGHVIHNIPGEPYDADEPRLRTDAKRRTKGPSVRLTAEQAHDCVKAFHEVCDKYALTIHAGAVMANHVHLVVSSPESEGARLLNLFKGVSSRRLGQRFGKQASGSWWTTGGSRRLLLNERAFENAVNYVRNQEHMLAACEFEPLPNPRIHPEPDQSPRVHAEPDQSPRVHAEPDQSPRIHAGRVSPDMNVGARAGVGARAVPARWPDADFIIGNPPFLGDKFLRRGLGDDYVEQLWCAFGGELPNQSDLCCYWFELARRAIERARGVRAGLLATQAIRGGANRSALDRIKGTGDVFFAVSDRDWVLDGAHVHVSMVGFDDGSEQTRTLDGELVSTINANLSTSDDLTRSQTLGENDAISFLGSCKGGPFDVGHDEARQLICEGGNPRGHSNVSVLRPVTNSQDLLGRTAPRWIIDNADRTLEDAASFAAVHALVEQRVKPLRDKNRDRWLRENWWRPQRMRPEMRAAVSAHSRFVVTPTTAKHRVFAWMLQPMLPDHQLIAFARSDDYFFGVLHSSIHELWARRMGTQLEDRPRYTPTTCFETFPLPWAPGKEPCLTSGVQTAPSPDIHAGRVPPDIHAGGIPPDMNVGAPAGDVGARAGDVGARADSSHLSPRVHAGRDQSPRIHAGRMPPGVNAGARVYERIATAARELNEQRERWLNPPEWIEPIAAAVDAADDFADVPEEARALIRQSAIMARAAKDPRLKNRTLTNLYNERPTWLKLAHAKLDRAVLAAYAAVDPEGNWSEDWTEVWTDSGAGFALEGDHPLAARRKEVDQLVLGNLLRMNLARAG
ncbi:MAG: transposase [Planctomycetes bacterium]|nr:transposase [Planctomycetota bacterium]